MKGRREPIHDSRDSDTEILHYKESNEDYNNDFQKPSLFIFELFLHIVILTQFMAYREASRT